MAPDTSTPFPQWEDPADATHSWRRCDDRPLSRLLADERRSYYDAARRCYQATGCPVVREHILKSFDGWPYVRAPEGTDDAADEKLRRIGERVLAMPEGVKQFYEEELRPQVVATVDGLRRAPRATRPLAEIVRHLAACIDAHSLVMGDLHWRLVAGGMADMRQDWPAAYAELTERPEAEAYVLLSGVTNELIGAVRRMRHLAAIAASDPQLLAAIESGDAAALDGDHEATRRFRSGFRALLRRYGLRTGSGWGSSTTYESPTWNMAPQIPLTMIATYARSDPETVRAKERQAARLRRTLLSDIRRSLAGDPERLQRFENALERATSTAWMMEDHNHWMDQCALGLLREAVHVAGVRLARDGVIDDPEDVIHIGLDELREIAAGTGRTDMRPIVDERRREDERRRAIEAPEHLGPPPPPTLELGDEGKGLEEGKLHGVAASSGRYTGRARVFMPSPVIPDVADGDILVGVDAGPDWTPVFAVLGAVVLDKGARFQHAAVMAREFGIPAVTGTKEGTSVITDGQTITVDGDSGIVELG